MPRLLITSLIVLVSISGCRSGRSPSRSGPDAASASPPAVDAAGTAAPAPAADAAVQTDTGPACQALLTRVFQQAVGVWGDLGFKDTPGDLESIYQAEAVEVLRACQLLRPDQVACLQGRPDLLGSAATCRIDRALRFGLPEGLEGRLPMALRPSCAPLDPRSRQALLEGLAGRWARPAGEGRAADLLVLDAHGVGQRTESIPGQPAGAARPIQLEPLTACTARRTLGEGADARSTEMLLVRGGADELVLAPLAFPLGARQPAPGKVARLAVDPSTVVLLGPTGCSVVRLDVLARYPATCQRQEAWLAVSYPADGQARKHRFEVFGDFLLTPAFLEANRLRRQPTPR